MGIGEVEDFELANGQRNHEPVREVAKHGQQIALAQINEAGGVVDDNGSHWARGPVICCST